MKPLNVFAKHPFFTFLMVFGLSFLATYIALGATLVSLLGIDNAQALFSGIDNDPGVIQFQKYLQCAMVMGIMTIPSLLFAYLVHEKMGAYFGVSIPKIQYWSLSLLLMIAAMPAVAWLTTINEALHLPSFLHSLELKMRSMEDLAKQQTLAFLKMETIGDLIFNVIMIGALAAIGEELVFRGVIQKSLQLHWNKPWLAIVVASFIFSFIHFQFYGFLPRFFLGLILGYTYYFSGSLWIPMLLHFLNNAVQVVLYYAFQKQHTSFNIDENPNVPWWVGVLSLLICLALVFWSQHNSKDSFENLNSST